MHVIGGHEGCLHPSRNVAGPLDIEPTVTYKYTVSGSIYSQDISPDLPHPISHEVCIPRRVRRSGMLHRKCGHHLPCWGLYDGPERRWYKLWRYDHVICVPKSLLKMVSAGWGQYFQYSASVTVSNQAIGGRSARSFTREGRFQTIINSVQSGDWVIIEFGHNDGGSLTPTDNGRTDCGGNGTETCTTVYK